MAIPHRVLELAGDRARVDEAGREHWIRLGGLADLKVGEYVTVYAGLAIERLEAAEAEEQLRFLADLAAGALERPPTEPSA